jgi:alkanesulfonate monooxygenase SsuD/methylene tetrahydromethanopterin reductase-like flavin-dependent oxidoreductase (luciferase family)
MPYAFAWFFTDGRGGREAIQMYKDGYKPSARHPEPNPGLCVWALAADSHEEAQHHYTSRAKWQLLRDRGRFTRLETPEEAMAYPFSEGEAARIEELRRKTFVGTAPEVAGRIRELAADVGVNEIAIVTWTWDEAVRRRSYELLAAEFGLSGTQRAAAE